MHLQYSTCLNLRCIYVHSEKLDKILSKFQCCFHEILHLNPVTLVSLPVCLHMPQAPTKRHFCLETLDCVQNSFHQDTKYTTARVTVTTKLTFHTKTRTCSFPNYFMIENIFHKEEFLHFFFFFFYHDFRYDFFYVSRGKRWLMLWVTLMYLKPWCNSSEKQQCCFASLTFKNLLVSMMIVFLTNHTYPYINT